MNALSRLVLRHGLTFLFLNVLLEQLGAPIPSVPTLVVAGALAAEGKLPGVAALAVAGVASLRGDAPGFALGRFHGRRILRLLCRVSLSPDACVRRTDDLFDRWGTWSLVVAKFVPGLSTVAPPIAGATGVGLGRFLLLSLAGALLWAGGALVAGALFHDAVDQILSAVAGLGARAMAVVLATLAAYVAVRWWQRRRLYKTLRMARISVDELDRLMKEGRPPLVADVRSERGRTQDPRRIPGAIALDADRLDDEIRSLPAEREIILYCT